MGGHAGNRLVVVKVIAKLGHVGVIGILALHPLALQQALGPQPLAHVLHQGRVFGPALAQNVAHAVQHGLGRREVRAGLAVVQHLGGLEVSSGLGQRMQTRIGPQRVGQWLDAEFPRNLPLGAALLLKRQVNVFQLLLGRRGGNRNAQRVGELALLVNAFEHRLAALGQLAQIAQPVLQFAQLNIVQAAGGLLAVAGNKGHRGPAVQQRDGAVHLLHFDLDFCGYLLVNVLGKLRGSGLHGCKENCRWVDCCMQPRIKA